MFNKQYLYIVTIMVALIAIPTTGHADSSLLSSIGSKKCSTVINMEEENPTAIRSALSIYITAFFAGIPVPERNPKSVYINMDEADAHEFADILLNRCRVLPNDYIWEIADGMLFELIANNK